MKKCYLIIGSNSFSGSNFINYILSKNVRVVGVSRSRELNKVYLPYKENKFIENFNFFKVDLNYDNSRLLKIIKKFKPSYIVNFSAQGMVAESWKHPIDWYQTNLISQIRLHDQIRKFKFIKKYIQFTTPEVYGSFVNKKKESFFFEPSTPYAASRAACDLHLKTFFKAYNFPVIFTRTANVYGPGQQLYRITPKSIMFAKLKKKISLDGGGNSIRSFIYIDDVSRALSMLLKKGKIGYTYHISTNKFVSVKKLVNNIFRKMKISKKNIKDVNDRLGKDHSYKLSSDLIRKEINWKEKINLNEGLKRTINWVNQNFNTLKNHKTKYIHKK
jgi:dTDP-glucose 4,6-dehydratase